MKVLLASMLMALVPPGAVSGGERFACNMSALTKSERAQYAKLTQTLLAVVQEKREL